MRVLAQSRGFSLWPESASTSAEDVDLVYLALLGLTLFFVVLIGAMALGFGVKYRAGAKSFRDHPIRKTLPIELTWIVAPLVMTLVIFVWGASVFVDLGTPPADARSIYVVGKQWMWKVQHPGGRQEINELHVPTAESIKLVLTSQDVIHSFYVPAFRIKRDALPNQYTSLWFRATRPGVYHLFCAEYCGTDHARMRGSVVVMTPTDYQQWLAEEVTERRSDGATRGRDEEKESGPDSATSRRIDVSTSPSAFVEFGCAACHQSNTTDAGPNLAGLFGRTVRLADGRVVVADEEFLRRSILEPNHAIPSGYGNSSSMPTYAGQINDDQMAELVEFIKSLETNGEGATQPDWPATTP